MSRIEEYKNRKLIYTDVKKYLNHARGLDYNGQRDIRNDKHDLHLEYTGKHTNDWNDAIFHLHGSYGYYGSSMGYSAMTKDVAHYFQRAIVEYMDNIAERAIELAKQDVESSARIAKEEAEEVLKAVTKEGEENEDK